MHLLRRARHVPVSGERCEEAQLVKGDLSERHFMILKHNIQNNELN
jgi:hypothetical protein